MFTVSVKTAYLFLFVLIYSEFFKLKKTQVKKK